MPGLDTDAAARDVIEKTLKICKDKLLAAWRDKSLLEIASGQFVPTWEYKNTKAWLSLGQEERRRLEGLIVRRKAESMVLWNGTARRSSKSLRIA